MHLMYTAFKSATRQSIIPKQGVTELSVTRSVFMFLAAVLVFVVLMLFIGIVLKIALVAALLAFAYYWFTRATQLRRRRRS